VNPTVDFVHQIIRLVRFEPLFILLAKAHPVFTKFIPLPKDFPPDDQINILRDGARFCINRSDYMQWHIYVNLPDHSWKSAIDHLSEGATIFDVGANSGAFSLKLAVNSYTTGIEQLTIHAFEPNPTVVDVFTENLKLNATLTERVKICPLALGNLDGTCAIQFDESNTGAGRVVENGESTIEILKLDTYVQENQIQNVTFIKIDVEGFEPEVLKGAKETIEKFKPALFIEMTDSWFKNKGSSCQEIIDQLLIWEYELLLETSNGLTPFDHTNPELTTTHQYNLLAKPR